MNDNLRWRTSSRSGQTGQCVEIARTADGAAVRDSKDPNGPVLRFNRDEIAGLFADLR
jgi:hypothetical protein